MPKRNDQCYFSFFLDESFRLDVIISKCLLMSRDLAAQTIKQGKVFVNDNNILKPAYRVSYRDVISIEIDKKNKLNDNFDEIINVQYLFGKSIKTDLWHIPVLFEDEWLMVLNKPAGLIVHPSKNVIGQTLLDIIQAADVPLAQGVGSHRPGIVHRLDQFTEGVMMIIKDENVLFDIQDQFKKRFVKKCYYAVLRGTLVASEGEINRPIGRDYSVRARQSCLNIVEGTQKEAITRYRVLNQQSTITVVDVELCTGRTHQIRVHFSALSCPVLGDALYSKQKQKTEGYYLQSYYLKFKHPKTKKDLEFKLPPSKRLSVYVKDEKNN